MPIALSGRWAFTSQMRAERTGFVDSEGEWLDKSLERPNGIRALYVVSGEPMDAQSLEAVATGLSALAAGGSVWAVLHVWNAQKKLTQQLEQRHDSLQRYLADKDAISARRAALVELWPYLIDIHRIDPEKSAPEEIRKAVNTLELVALCWEANIIDKEVIQRTFESTYINIYEQILSITRKLPSLEKTGRELLNENPAAIELYNELKKMQIGRGRISA